MDDHNPVSSLLTPPDPSSPPEAVSYFHPHVHRYLTMSGSGPALTKVRTCHSLGSGGGGDSLSLELLPCLPRGGACSGSRGWCASYPAPCSPPLDTRWTRLLQGIILYISWVTVWRAVSPMGLMMGYQQPRHQIQLIIRTQTLSHCHSKKYGPTLVIHRL